VKTIFENMPKNNLEPALKYDSHVYKNASKVTSLLSYRAFEHTQVSEFFIMTFCFVMCSDVTCCVSEFLLCFIPAILL